MLRSLISLSPECLGLRPFRQSRSICQASFGADRCTRFLISPSYSGASRIQLPRQITNFLTAGVAGAIRRHSQLLGCVQYCYWAASSTARRTD